MGIKRDRDGKTIIPVLAPRPQYMPLLPISLIALLLLQPNVGTRSKPIRPLIVFRDGSWGSHPQTGALSSPGTVLSL